MTVKQAVHKFAALHGLSRNLVAAIVQVESGGDPWAIRYEPGYRWLWDVRKNEPWTIAPDLEPRHHAPPTFPAPAYVSSATEFTAQRTSWGAMQVMGAVAREQGFDAPYLSELCDPFTGVKYGCLYLATLSRRHGNSDPEALAAAYNAGSPRRDSDGAWRNQGYVDKVREAGGFK